MTRLTSAQTKAIEFLRANPNATLNEQHKAIHHRTMEVLKREGLVVYIEDDRYYLLDGQTCEIPMLDTKVRYTIPYEERVRLGLANSNREMMENLERSSVRRSWGQGYPDEPEQGYPDEPMFTAEEIESRINTLSNEWVQDRQAAGYSVGFSNIVKRTPTKVSKRAAKFFRELAKAA